MPAIIFSTIIFLYGIIIGSFLNVCICRIPKKENIVTTRSHCMSCGYQLKWYDLIPLFSWLALRGRCRKCGQRISVQYPVIEVLNGILYLVVFWRCGMSVQAVLYCFMASALMVISVIDWRTYEIPVGANVFIGALGVVRLVADLENWQDYVVGFFSVSVLLLAIYAVTRGRGIGGGDIKLMAASGLLLGWKCNVLAFVLGCIAGSVVHIIRMKVSKADHVLALGPYLSIGIFVSALWGGQMIGWYISML